MRVTTKNGYSFYMAFSNLIHQTVMGQIETKYDLEMFDRAMVEYKNTPITYSLSEVEKELGLRLLAKVMIIKLHFLF